MAVIENVVEICQNIIRYFLANPVWIGVVLFVYVLIFLLSILFSSTKSGPNPFSKDERELVEKLVTDQSARDKVLKQGFTSKKVPDEVDAIVIGSGMGGLTAAALLAKAGQKILVLEQHDQAGGCCHTFIEKGFEFDVGIHYIGKLAEGSLSHTILSQMTRGQLQWIRLDESYDTVSIGEGEGRSLYPIPSGEKTYRDTLVKWFPEEEANIDKYMALLNKVDKQFMGGILLKVVPAWLSRLLVRTGLIHLITGYYKQANQTVTQVLDSITDNQRLKAVLAYNFGDYGTVPDEASFTMHVVLTKHFMKGGYYPMGGASEIAYHIIPTIEKAGGKVLVRAPVSEILMTGNGRAHGVRVSKTSGDVDIYAPMIISAAGVINTFKTLLPKHISQKTGAYQLLTEGRIRSGVGGLSVFVGLDASKEELGLEAKNVWAFSRDNLDAAFHEYITLTAEEAVSRDVPLLFISFPSTKDPTWETRYPGRTTLAIITLAPWRWFEEWEKEKVMHRGEDYEGLKMALGQRVFEQVCRLYPQIADKKVYMDVGSPLTNQYYIGSPRGEFYGLDHDVGRFGSPEVTMALRPETEIQGLYLSGQDVATCGFTGALFGGLLCASVILQRNLINDVIALRNTIRKSEKKTKSF